MKNLFIFMSIFALVACSSKKKEEISAPQPAMKDGATTSAAKVPQKNTMTMDSGANMEGGFPDVEGTERSGATCKNGGEERLISVIDTREGPCGVVYTKYNNKKTVAYAQFEMGFCDKVFDNIVGNLSGGGFDCGEAAGTASSPEESSSQEEASSDSQ